MTASPLSPSPPAYRLGVFCLVRQQDKVLLVRPHQLLLPGGPQSLPGVLLEEAEPGLGVVEAALRRHLLSQVGVAVAEFRLIGSHVIRTGRPENPVLRLNLILGSEYCSGIPNPQTDVYKSAMWLPVAQLAAGALPEWLRAAMQELMLLPSSPPPTQDTGNSRGLFRRRTG